MHFRYKQEWLDVKNKNTKKLYSWWIITYNNPFTINMEGGGQEDTFFIVFAYSRFQACRLITRYMKKLDPTNFYRRKNIIYRLGELDAENYSPKVFCGPELGYAPVLTLNGWYCNRGYYGGQRIWSFVPSCYSDIEKDSKRGKLYFFWVECDNNMKACKEGSKNCLLLTASSELEARLLSDELIYFGEKVNKINSESKFYNIGDAPEKLKYKKNILFCKTEIQVWMVSTPGAPTPRA